MSDELKPCPFCGAPASLEEVTNHPLDACRWSAGCHTEHCMGYLSMTTFDRKSEAIAAWNRRSPTGGQEAERAEILKGVAEWANADGGPGIGPLVKAWLRTQIGTQQWTMGASAVYAAMKEPGK